LEDAVDAEEGVYVDRAIDGGALALATHPPTLATWALLDADTPRVEMFDLCLRPLVAEKDWPLLCRIAWFSLLTGRERIGPGDDALARDSLTTDNDALRRVLRSGLFRHHRGRAAFVDQAFVEYLAAWYGARRVPGARRMLDTVLVNVGDGFKLAPFAAWLISHPRAERGCSTGWFTATGRGACRWATSCAGPRSDSCTPGSPSNCVHS